MKFSAFIKKLFIYFVGTLSTKMLSVLLIPIYAYFVSAEELGKYDYIVAISNILVPVIYVVIWEAALKFCIKVKNIEKKDSLISSIVFFYIGSSLVLFILTMSFYNIIDRNLNIWLVFLFTFFQGGTLIWQFFARALKENTCFVKAGIAGSLALIIVECIFIHLQKLNYVMLIVSNLISQIIIFSVLERKLKLLTKISWKNVCIKDLKQMLQFSFPLVINNISLWMYSSGSKVIIQNYVGSIETGLYSFASKFSILINLLSTVISMAVIEEAYSFNSLEEYKIKMSSLISIISQLYFSLIVLALPALYILYNIAFFNTEYYKSVDYILPLLLSALFTALSNNFGSSFQVTNNTKYIFLTTLMGALGALVVSLWLVKSVGIYGVLVGGMIGPLIMMVTRAIYAYKYTGLCINWRKNIGICLVGIVISIFLMNKKSLDVQMFLFGLMVLFVFVEYKEYIRKFGSLIKKKYFRGRKI